MCLTKKKKCYYNIHPRHIAPIHFNIIIFFPECMMRHMRHHIKYPVVISYPPSIPFIKLYFFLPASIPHILNDTRTTPKKKIKIVFVIFFVTNQKKKKKKSGKKIHIKHDMRQRTFYPVKCSRIHFIVCSNSIPGQCICALGHFERIHTHIDKEKSM